MKLTRRDALALGLGTTAASFLPSQAISKAQAEIVDFTDGAGILQGAIRIDVERRFQSGDSLIINVAAEEFDAILLLLPAGQNVVLARHEFPHGQKEFSVTTEISLGAPQEVVALARTSDGKFIKTATVIDVAQLG